MCGVCAPDAAVGGSSEDSSEGGPLNDTAAKFVVSQLTLDSNAYKTMDATRSSLALSNWC